MKYLLPILIILIVFCLYQIFRTRYYIGLGTEIAKNTQPYEQNPENPDFSILVIGDSTGYGTGASTPEKSIIGLIGNEYPNAKIVNKAKNGAKVSDLIPILESIEERYDAIFIHVGGNDILRFTPYDEFEQDLRLVLEMAQTKADHVMYTSCGNVGTILTFPPGAGYIYDKRTRRVREIILKVTEEKDIVYNDLFNEPENDPFYKDPDKYYAADYLHPSDEGYAEWFKVVGEGLKKLDIQK